MGNEQMSNEPTSNQLESSTEKTFAEGDLGRVQGLLFGDQFEAINARIDSIEAMLLENITAVRTEMRKEFAVTDRKVDKNKAQIDKRLDTKIEKEAAARKSALVDLTAMANNGTAELQSEIASKAAAFEKSLDALKTATDKAIASSRSSLEEQIQNTEQTLSNSKVDRSILANLLAQTAEQLVAEEKTGPKKVDRVA